MGVHALALATVVAGAGPPPDPEPAPASQRADIPARREVHRACKCTALDAALQENRRSSQAPFQSRVRTWPGLGRCGNYGIILIMGNAGFILLIVSSATLHTLHIFNILRMKRQRRQP